MKHAYLTCELKSRDLDSRLLIAARLLERGVSVVVGQQWSISGNGPSMPSGAVLFKTANRIQAGAMQRMKAAGHKIVLMDEEILAATSSYLILLGTDSQALAACDIFLFQDKAHEDLVRSTFPDINGRIAGNSRVDLMQTIGDLYKEEAAAHRARGPYVLINTNFTMTNSIWGNVESALQVAAEGRAIDIETPRGRAFARDWADTEQENRKAIVDIIVWLRQNIKSHRIVVRPHPGEQAKNWSSFQGIEIARGTNPASWLLGADLTIHTNSTTGLEAALLERPCLNVCPLPNSEFSTAYITRQANFTVTTVTAATEAIEKFLGNSGGPIRQFKNLVRFEKGASGIIAEEIDRLAPDSPEIRSWSPVKLEETKRDKFPVSIDEFIARMNKIFGAVNAKAPNVAILDEALFYLKPT